MFPIYNDLMNQAAYLHRLQRIDTQIDHIDSRLAEIERLLAEDERVRAAKKSADDARQTLEKSRLNLRSMEHSVTETRIKIDQSNAMLYGGTIRNPKELQDLQREIESLTHRLSQLEDQQLEAMINQEEAENLEQLAQTEYRNAQAKAIEEKAGLVGEQETLKKNRLRFIAERSVAITPISSSSLEIYNHLREQRKGIVVAVVEDNTCGVCGSQIRPAESQAARISPDLQYCSFCGRILFAG
jgi:predicted  nucleic acid-binding Zn-ribbon protein